MTRFDLTPLFRSSVGFDRFSNLFDSVMRGDENIPSYPPYNIEKAGEDDYRIVLAVAGFREADLTLTVQENQLTVSGAQQDAAERKGTDFLYKGIANRSFERKFSLADHVKVTGAALADGLLTISLKRELPESSKPRMIAINGKHAIDGKKAN
jgi:molecular chaperone IbpA